MNTNDLYVKQTGSKGLTVGDGITEVTGTFYAVQCLTACTFSAMTIAGLTGTITGKVIPAGTIIYGKITAITGSADNSYILYKG